MPRRPAKGGTPRNDEKHEEKLEGTEKVELKPASFIPVFEAQEPSIKTIRRSGLEIKKAEEQEEKKRLDQEKEWEIPAFLRRVKFKN